MRRLTVQTSIGKVTMNMLFVGFLGFLVCLVFVLIFGASWALKRSWLLKWKRALAELEKESPAPTAPRPIEADHVAPAPSMPTLALA